MGDIDDTTTLVDLLDRAAEAPRDGPPVGLRFLDRRENESFHTWAEIHAEAGRAARVLVELGIRPGERVALVYSTSPEFFHAFFGILTAGAVPVPLYPPVRLGRLDEYHRRTARMLRAASARLVLAEPRVKRLLGKTIAAARPALGCRTLGDLPDAGSGAPSAARRPSPDDLALVQFSSGTTVDPKPVALSHRAVVRHTLILNGFWPDDGSIRHSGVSWLPLYHDMGLIGCVFPALERPSVLTLLGPEVFVARPATWLKAISRMAATISVAPNFAFGLAVDKIRDEELEGVDLSPWRVALNGAEPIAPAVLRRFQERFARWGFRPEALTPVYGLSEASLAVTFTDLHRPFETTCFDRTALAEGRVCPAQDGVELPSLGKPIPGLEVRLVDADHADVEAGHIGQVEVRGPTLMEGYLDRPEATAAALHDGWLDTGDLGFFHGGELYLTGRLKDVLILRGRNYAPTDLEQSVDEVDGARTGCTIAASYLPEDADHERVLLFVERAQNVEVDDDRLAQAAREAVLARTGIKVDRVHILEPGTLPRTSSGKLRRQEALRRHLACELSAPKRVTPFLLGRELVRSAVAHATAGRPGGEKQAAGDGGRDRDRDRDRDGDAG